MRGSLSAVSIPTLLEQAEAVLARQAVRANQSFSCAFYRPAHCGSAGG